MYLNTVFKYNVFKYCPALRMSLLLEIKRKGKLPYLLDDCKDLGRRIAIFH